MNRYRLAWIVFVVLSCSGCYFLMKPAKGYMMFPRDLPVAKIGTPYDVTAFWVYDGHPDPKFEDFTFTFPPESGFYVEKGDCYGVNFSAVCNDLSSYEDKRDCRDLDLSDACNYRSVEDTTVYFRIKGMPQKEGTIELSILKDTGFRTIKDIEVSP